MPKTLQTAAIIRAIETAATTAAAAAVVAAEHASKELNAHTKDDEDRFATLTTLVGSVANDVKSLIQYRAFIGGIWRAVVITAITFSTLATIVVMWVKR